MTVQPSMADPGSAEFFLPQLCDAPDVATLAGGSPEHKRPRHALVPFSGPTVGPSLDDELVSDVGTARSSNVAELQQSLALAEADRKVQQLRLELLRASARSATSSLP